MKRIILPLLIALPTMTFAAGGDGPPNDTQTTKTCKNGKVWSTAKKRCVNPGYKGLDQETLYQAAREMAYNGRYDDAQNVLRAMEESDRTLTYWGFTYRKMGQTELANAYYEKAIATNPDNILARSYMGQGFVAEGRVEDAIVQWREIKARGGEGSWAEASLREAIQTGMTYNY